MIPAPTRAAAPTAARIVEAATNQFFARGYHGASMPTALVRISLLSPLVPAESRVLTTQSDGHRLSEVAPSLNGN